MKKTHKIAILISIMLLFSMIYFLIIESFFSSLSWYLKVLIYVLFVFLILGPFLPKKTKTRSFFDNIFLKIKSQTKQKNRLEVDGRRKINLDLTHRPPLISECKCGMLLSASVKTCPQCGVENLNYHRGYRKIKK